MDLPFHPSLLPTLLLALISIPAAAVLRRTVRKEYRSLLPWLMLWGTLCTIPALMFVLLCLPGFSGAADWLNGSRTGTWTEVLAGIAGVLPGLLWDDSAERIEQNRPPLFGLPVPVLRALSIAVLAILILIPYGFLFKQQTADAPAQTETVFQPGVDTGRGGLNHRKGRRILCAFSRSGLISASANAILIDCM